MKLLISSLLLIGACSIAQADEILIDTLSFHTKGHYEVSVPNGKHYWDANGTLQPFYDQKSLSYNNINPGIGYKFDNGVFLGYYDNSYHKPTFYGAYEHVLYSKLWVLAGLATGYQEAVGRNVTILAGFEYKQQLTNKISANILFLPPINKSTGIVHLMLSYKLDK